MNNWVPRLARIGIAVICAFALYKLSGVITLHIQGKACPMLGPVPACYLVFLGYAAMLLAVVFNPLRTLWLFMTGWAPVFFLALSGTVLELFSKPTCPRTDSDTPMCFLSLGVASLLIVMLFIARRTQADKSKHDQETSDVDILRKFFTAGAMIFSLLSFLIFILTPMPGGALLFSFSLVLLICTSEWAASQLLALRVRFSAFNKGMTWLEDKMGERTGGILRSTRPEPEPVPVPEDE